MDLELKTPLLVPLDDYDSSLNKVEDKGKHSSTSPTTLKFRHPLENPILLDVGIVWSCLSDINASTQTFAAKVEIWIAWNLTETELDLYLQEPQKWKPAFMPSIYPINDVALDQLEYLTFANKRNVQVYQAKSGLVKACQCVIMSGTFSESFKLQNFPFDVQHLNLQFLVRTENDNFASVGGKLVKEVDNRSGFMNWDGKFQTRMYVNPRNTKYSCVVGRMSFAEYTVKNTELTFLNRDDDVPVITCRIVVLRNWRYYFWKVYFLLTIISFACLASFFFGDSSTIADRINFLSTLLLSAVAFLFVVASALPSLAYLTMLDKFLYASFGEIIMIGVANVVLSRLSLLGSNEEMIVLYALFGVWFLKNLVYVIVSIRAYRVEIEKLNMTKEEVDKDSKFEQALLSHANEKFRKFCNFSVWPSSDVFTNEKGRRVYKGTKCESFSEVPWIVD